MYMNWTQRTFLSIDTETTGLEFGEDRVIQLGYSVFAWRKHITTNSYILDSGKDSSPEAIAVHGITNEMQQEGHSPKPILSRLAQHIETMRQTGKPLVIMNAPFDLNMLIGDWKRHGIPVCLDEINVIDPLVIDRFFSKNRIPAYKSGARTLNALAMRYGVPDYPLHDAGHDARKAGEVALNMTGMYGQLQRYPMPVLQQRQRKWHADWTSGFLKFGERKGFPVRQTIWPHDPIPEEDIQEMLNNVH
jgi:DNA polymerase III subunit epsilon